MIATFKNHVFKNFQRISSSVAHEPQKNDRRWKTDEKMKNE